MKSVSFIVAAAGKGERVGGETSKLFRPLSGRMVWEWSAVLAEKLFSSHLISEVIFVVPRGKKDSITEKLHPFGFPFSVVAGGPERSGSVLNGVNAASGEYVLIHDGARPLASLDLCERVIGALSLEKGVVPLLPITDALKKWDKEKEITSFPRDGLFLTQTPQGFHRISLKNALRQSGVGAKDEGDAWIAAGHHLNVVKGERRNMKITWPDDFSLAEIHFQRTFRTGFGYDVHSLIPGRKFILGGVPIFDFPLGFQGHSDGDVLTHAVCDALLGAAGLSDIGTLFPASNMKYKDIPSLLLLKDVAEKVYSAGWTLEWCDGVIVAQEPPLASLLLHIKNSLEEQLPCNWRSRLHVKVKSGEGEGAVGTCSSIVCYVTATLSIPSRFLCELEKKEGKNLS